MKSLIYSLYIQLFLLPNKNLLGIMIDINAKQIGD